MTASPLTTSSVEGERTPDTQVRGSAIKADAATRPVVTTGKVAEIATDMPISDEQRCDVPTPTYPHQQQSVRESEPPVSPRSTRAAQSGVLALEDAAFPAAANDKDSASTAIGTSLPPGTPVGKQACERAPELSPPSEEEEARDTRTRRAYGGKGQDLSLGAPILNRQTPDPCSEGSPREHTVPSRLLKLGTVPTPPFNTPAASSPSVAAAAEQNLASVLSAEALSADMLKGSVLASETAIDSPRAEIFDQTDVQRREAEASGAGSRRDDGVDATWKEEVRRDFGVDEAGKVETDALKLLTAMVRERSTYYPYDVTPGIFNTRPATSDSSENGDIAEDVRLASNTLPAEHAVPVESNGPAASSLTTDEDSAVGPAEAKESVAEVVHRCQAMVAVVPRFIDECAATSITPRIPANCRTNSQDNVIGSNSAAPEIGGENEVDKRVNFASNDVAPGELNNRDFGSSSPADNTKLKRPFNQQNNLVPRFAAVRTSDAAEGEENELEMLGERLVPYADSDPSSPSLFSTLSSASTIAKLSGVVASKARGETHPTEPHKSPKRVRYDAHGRGAYIPVSDDEAEDGTPVDDIRDTSGRDELRRERERSADSVLGTVSSLATASKETIVKALDVLMPARLPKVDPKAEFTKISEVGQTAAITAAQAPAVTGKLAEEPTSAKTEPRFGDHDHQASSMIKDSVGSAAETVEAILQPTASTGKLPQDIQKVSAAAFHYPAEQKPELEHSCLRQRGSASARPKSTTEATETPSCAKMDAGGWRLEWLAGYALAAAGSLLLVYVIVPLVVRAVTAA